MLIALASVTDSLVTLATHVIRDLGLAGVALLTLTSGVVGAPGSEPTMLFAGFNVYQGHLSLFGIVLFGVIGDMLGASIAYAIGYFGSRELIQHQGKYLHISEKRVDLAHSWFERYGAPVIVVSRWIPFARAAFPYAAGVARMGYLRFGAFATIGSIVWIAALGVLGREVGSELAELAAQPRVRRLRRRRPARRGDRVPDRAGHADAARRPDGRRVGVRGWRPTICRSGRRSSSARSTDRPSCCRSPPRVTSRSSPGSPAGTTRGSTTSCASRSRWRSTPARRRRS